LSLDTVARERELIGMDSNIKNLLDRYKTLPENEKRLLEHDEDRLLATILYNMAAFMIMMQVPVERIYNSKMIFLMNSIIVSSLHVP
jgi:hypothetical protein